MFLAPLDDGVPHTYDDGSISGAMQPELVARHRKPKMSRDVSLMTILRDLQDIKYTVVDLLAFVVEGDGEFGPFRHALFSPRNRTSLNKLFERLIQDDKGGPIMKDWVFSHSVLLVCGRIHAEMEDAKQHLRMNTADVTPEFIEQWDIYKIMKGVSSDTTPTLTTILQAAGESKASQAKAKSAKSKNRVTVRI